MLEVMNADYIRTARAKGLTERTVVVRHGFRNALIPITTIIALDVGGLDRRRRHHRNRLRLGGHGKVLQRCAEDSRPQRGDGLLPGHRDLRSCSPTWSPTSSTGSSTQGFGCHEHWRKAPAARRPPTPAGSAPEARPQSAPSVDGRPGSEHRRPHPGPTGSTPILPAPGGDDLADHPDPGHPAGLHLDRLRRHPRLVDLGLHHPGQGDQPRRTDAECPARPSWAATASPSACTRSVRTTLVATTSR